MNQNKNAPQPQDAQEDIKALLGHKDKILSHGDQIKLHYTLNVFEFTPYFFQVDLSVRDGLTMSFILPKEKWNTQKSKKETIQELRDYYISLMNVEEALVHAK